MDCLGRENCGDEISVKELRKIQLDMLKAFVTFCENNSIHYYLAGGTLLGAIRHKGFIPWDDDIDVSVPRPECEKLQKLTNGKIGKYVLQQPDANCPFHAESWRLYDTAVVIESSLGRTSKRPVYIPAFIDIFPIEGLPNTVGETRRHYQKLIPNRKLINCTMGSLWYGKTLKSKLFHLIMRPVANLIGYKTLYRNIQKEVTKYAFEESKYIGVMTAPVHTVEERMLKSEYVPQVELEFEGMKLTAPKNYDAYLTQLYGADYMKLPPEEKRVSHHGFRLYRYKGDQL